MTTIKQDIPYVDPTPNVLALVEASVKRIDDLRLETIKYTDVQVGHIKEMAELRDEHSKQIRASEADRLDKIRQVDIGNTAAAAAQALTAIKTLADTTAAALLINQKAVTDTATAQATQLANTVGRIDERIASLERASYEGVGKQRLADPMMAELVAEMKKVSTAQASVPARREGASEMAKIIAGGFGLLLTLVSIIGAVVAFKL